MQEVQYLILAVVCSLSLSSKIPLDMAPDAVDDMYEGCSKDALNTFVLSDLLQEEMNQSIDFQKAWHQSQSACPKLIPGGLKQHTTALLTIASDDDKFRKTLNDAVFTNGVNSTIYEDRFNFKSIHFLLMDSLRMLHTGQNVCTTMYAFSDFDFNAVKGSIVRLGRFTVGYPSLQTLKKRDIDDEVILSITSCFFANLGGNICNEEPSILVSPAEVFRVEDVRTVKEDEDLSYHLIVLKHSKLKSEHNCYVFSRSPEFNLHCYFLVLLSPFFLFMS